MNAASDHASDLPHTSLYRFSWFIVFYTVLVIAWGAWVRISGSGDGCGEHWPLCHGEAVPLGASTKTWVEVSHRYSTALYGLFVLAQLFLVVRGFIRKHPARTWATATLIFTIVEALIGRQLVLLRLVNESTDLLRVVIMPLHLVNTSLLLFATVMTAESVRYGERVRVTLSTAVKRYGALVLTTLLLLLTTGAIAALGSHLAPSESLLAGMTRDWSSDSHLAVRLRILHPALALLFGIALLLLASSAIEAVKSNEARWWYSLFGKTLFAAMVIGITTLLTLAPAWLKLTHLTAANLLIIVASGCVFHTLRAKP